MITVGEIISTTNFDEVLAEYIKHYEETHRTKVEDVFLKLKEAQPSENNDNMILFIRAIKENAHGDDVVLETFDCDDPSVFFDVCGIADDHDGLYSIASADYGDLLSFFVREDTLERFNSAQIIAHIIWSLDW